MKEYKIFEHPNGKKEAVKQGWSWPAFFFGLIWALVKKMWALGLGIFFAGFILGFIAGVVGGETGRTLDRLLSAAALVLSVVFGVEGNKLRQRNLQSRGFNYKTTVNATTPEDALVLYMKQSSPEGYTR